jgi:hypothetical protein
MIAKCNPKKSLPLWEYKKVYNQYTYNQSTTAEYNPKELEIFPDIRESEKDRFLQCVKENIQIAEKMEKELPALIEELKRNFRKTIKDK